MSWQAPTMEFSTAAFVLGTPGHSWQVVAQSGSGLGHKSLIFASKVIAGAALDLISKGRLIEKAWEELKERTRGRAYKSPIPREMKPPLNFWSKGSKTL